MKQIPLVVAVVLALAAAGFAWQRNQALEASRAELAQAQGNLQKAQADLKTLSAEVAPLRKEAAESKAAAEQLRAEVGSAKAFLEAERAATMRVREELAMAKEQLAFVGKSRAAQQQPRDFGAPMMVRPAPPIRVEAAPAPAPQGNAVRAQ